MARLNEISAPVESVDALKRRFVRQNRELARINSNQSVRIRNLESEISRLLSENIAIRERVISLQHEMNRSPEETAMISIGLVHSQLEAKLGEMGELVQELGKAHGSMRVVRTSRRRSMKQSSPKKSPDQKNWKNALTLSEVTGGSESSRLPPIIEDKAYPRRTLDSEELLHILDDANASDSPELGPPPIATFQDGNPIKYDAEEKPAELVTMADDPGDFQVPRGTNLETRKKRRESSHRPEGGLVVSGGDSRLQCLQSGNGSILQPRAFKAGAKRKYSSREEKEVSGVTKAKDTTLLSKDYESGNHNDEESRGSSYIDAVELVQSQQRTKTHQTSSIAEGKLTPFVSRPATKARKALGPKSTNQGPLRSPAKVEGLNRESRARNSQDYITTKPRDRQRNGKTSSARQSDQYSMNGIPNEQSIPVAQGAAPPPETPAPPPPDPSTTSASEQSAAHPKARDTPPPSDIDTDTASLVGRATRRPRGSISYTEPNLRDKMRRPTKEFINAVAADDRLLPVKDEAVNRKETTSEKRSIKTITIKREDPGEGTGMMWKDLPLSVNDEHQPHAGGNDPTSPLSNKSSLAKQRPKIAVAEDIYSEHTCLSEEKVDTSLASGSTITALVAVGKKMREREANQTDGRNEERENVFKPKASSLSDAVNQEETLSSVRTTSRRYSSIENDAETEPSKRGNRRRESTLGLRGREEEQQNAGCELKGVSSVGSLRKPAVGTTSGRAERSASRRETMML